MKAVSAAIVVLAGAVFAQKEEGIGYIIGVIGFLAWIFAFVTAPAANE